MAVVAVVAVIVYMLVVVMIVVRMIIKAARLRCKIVVANGAAGVGGRAGWNC